MPSQNYKNKLEFQFYFDLCKPLKIRYVMYVKHFTMQSEKVWFLLKIITNSALKIESDIKPKNVF